MKFTGLIASTVSGSLGGVTGSRNRGGQYLRRRSIPTNPNSTLQATRRASLANAVASWTAILTDSQREAWKTWAQNVPFVDSLGQTYYLTGQQAYIRSALRLAPTGAGFVNPGPTVFNNGPAPEVLTVFTLGAAAQQIDITFTTSAETPDAGDAIVYLGRPLNSTVNFFKGPYQYAFTFSFSDTTDTHSTTDAPVLTDWSIAVGQYLPVKIVMVYDDGRSPHPLSLIAQLGANVP